MVPAKKNFIDGFTSVQAVRRAGERQGVSAANKQKRQAPSRADKPPAKKADTRRAGHTAMPTRHKIECYACGYQHTVAGALKNILCPKCKKKLETGDKAVLGQWDENVSTISNVDIAADSVLGNVKVTGNTITLAGDARKATLKATSQIEVITGAQLDVTRVETHKLKIPAGSSIEINQTVDCVELEIGGELKANVIAKSRVNILEGGVLDGKVKSPALIVQDGGGLRADVDVRSR